MEVECNHSFKELLICHDNEFAIIAGREYHKLCQICNRNYEINNAVLIMSNYYSAITPFNTWSREHTKHESKNGRNGRFSIKEIVYNVCKAREFSLSSLVTDLFVCPVK